MEHRPIHNQSNFPTSITVNLRNENSGSIWSTSNSSAATSQLRRKVSPILLINVSFKSAAFSLRNSQNSGYSPALAAPCRERRCTMSRFSHPCRGPRFRNDSGTLPGSAPSPVPPEKSPSRKKVSRLQLPDSNALRAENKHFGQSGFV